MTRSRWFLRSRGLLGLAAFFLVFSALKLIAAPGPTTQTLRLAAGWNLVSFQVFPLDSSPAGVFGSLGANFVAAMSFDAVTQTWTHYQNPTQPSATTADDIAS